MWKSYYIALLCLGTKWVFESFRRHPLYLSMRQGVPREFQLRKETHPFGWGGTIPWAGVPESMKGGKGEI